MDNNFYTKKMAIYQRLMDRLLLAREAVEALQRHEATVNPDGDEAISWIEVDIRRAIAAADAEMDAVAPLLP